MVDLFTRTRGYASTKVVADEPGKNGGGLEISLAGATLEGRQPTTPPGVYMGSKGDLPPLTPDRMYISLRH